MFKKIVIWLFVLFILLLFLWAIFSPKDTFEEKIQQTLAEQKERADLKFVDVTFSETFGGVKYWELDAKTSSFNKDQETADLVIVNGRFYKNNDPVLKFISPKVFWNMQQKEITIQNPLGYDLVTEKNLKNLQRLIGKQTDPQIIYKSAANISGRIAGAWFKANQLNWNLKIKKLFCSSGIVFNRGAITIYAKNLEGDVALSMVALTGDPIAQLILKEENAVVKATTVTADKFLVNSRDNKISAVDNVLVEAKDTSITAKQADYAINADQLVLTGKINIMHKDIQAVCRRATLLPAKETVILEKGARAQRDQNEIRGDKITINLKNAKISVAGKTKIVVSDEEFDLP